MSAQRQRRFDQAPVVLMVVASVLALLMAGLLVFEWNQRQALHERQQQRLDSITAPAFLLDRELLRLDTALYELSSNPGETELADVRLRLDRLADQIKLLRGAHGAARLLQDPAATSTLNELQAMWVQANQWIQREPLDRQALQHLRQRVRAMGEDTQALGMRADGLVSGLLEQQTEALLQQSTQVMVLIGLQMLLVIAALAGLLWRHRNHRRERQALRALNRDLRMANAQAERSNRGKSVFLANMSHELRTPFNGIMGWLDVLDQSPLQSDQREWVATIRRSADHLLQLLNDILDMSALEAGKMVMRSTPTDLPTMLRDVDALMQPAARAKDLELRLEMDLPDTLWVQVDPTRLRQVIINLTNNAIKFTQQGTVRIHAYRQTVTHNGHETPMLTVDVCDTGVGISEPDLRHLFQRFHQVQDDLNRRYNGAGLGLQISLSLARMMGGDITVTSTVGQGSTFRFSMPEQRAEPPAPVDPRKVDTGNLPALKVLVAEDNVINQQYMRAVLTRLNCKVTVCSDGKQALDAARRECFDLALMDIHMPEMDGLEATQHIRQLPDGHGSMPIYALTADVFEETRDSAIVMGVDKVLTKPLRLSALREALSDIPVRQLPANAPPAEPAT